MKKLILIIILVFLETTAYASYTSVLYNELKSNDKLFFAYTANFSDDEKLITVSETSDGLLIRALSEDDGEELSDEFNIVTGGDNIYRLSVVKTGVHECILLETNDIKELYTVEDDTFKRVSMREYSVVTKIAESRFGVTDTFGNTKGGAYNLLNTMKLDKIKDYDFIDIKGSMEKSEETSLRNIIASAADIMYYDINDNNIDDIMVRVLNTCENFKELVPVSAGEFSGGEVGLVKVEYIDYIMTRLFGIEPPHPAVNELISRGYCTNNGYYNYTRAYNIPFSTEIRDIEAVYETEKGVYFVIFGDIYTENGVSIPEYSHMILQSSENGYKILKIDMGGELPDEHTVMEYTDKKERRHFFWEEEHENKDENGVIGYVLLIGIGALLFIVILKAILKR